MNDHHQPRAQPVKTHRKPAAKATRSIRIQEDAKSAEPRYGPGWLREEV
ncbi:hypothetical protein H0484_11260 [Pusillimonas sp. CC-YST705]|uniref:DUF2934 domain-containing protein n=1 Tax=Mesopusillimonas faecipullorum TaxID=2755040 RepID=A0ABS8CE60_9BURK|nr:hypothetical protein [Mesopusillimonas faecipullorum]MCB5364325.1 hypothetical protein [Mesopusillimonas faecipullorum]